jgi:phospholipid N-methyltransferase
MGEDTTLLAFEVNDEFVRTLRRKAIHPNVRVINDSAERVEDHLRKHGFEGADYIFSGIPFTALPASIREKILRATNDALAPTGKFIAYQYSPYLMKLLRSIFEDVQVSIEPRNIPPAFCFTCSKRT